MSEARMPREETPRFVAPMLARSGPPPAQAGWSLELKLDGCRGQFRCDARGWTLRSRPGRLCGDGFPELQALADALRGRRVLLDGELVCLGQDGKPDFHALRPRMLGRAGAPATLAVFDLLHLDGRSTRGLPLARRRELLAEVVPAAWIAAPLAGPVEDVVRVVREAQLEGVVAKRLDARYEPGARSAAWLKHKLRRSETFVVTGRAPARDRRPEAVLLARLGPDGVTRPAGAAAFGLSRAERDRLRAGARVLVDHHGRPDGPVRDAVMRRLVAGCDPAPRR